MSVKKRSILAVSVLVVLLAVAWVLLSNRNGSSSSAPVDAGADVSYAQAQVAKAKAGPVDRLLSRTLSPGALAAPHKDIGSCFACHTAWTSVKEKGCTSCHREEQLLESDRKNAAATHQTAAGKVTCTACHTDHRGLDAKITLPYDHNRLPPQTRADCASCHTASEKTQNHARGWGGAACSQCHTTSAWTPAKYVHPQGAQPGVTVSATGAEQGRSCSQCHVSETRVHAEQGKYGPSCQLCHATESWKPTAFTHLSKTASSPEPAGHPPGGPAGCINCHARENPSHGNQYGNACGACHATSQWKGASADPLSLATVTGSASCASCHLDKMSVHLAQPEYGTDCSRCHTLTTWKNVTMDHTVVQGQACSTCHASPQTATHPQISVLNVTCSACHTTRAWRPVSFDHTNVTDSSGASCTKCHADKINGAHQGGSVFNATCTLCHSVRDPKQTAIDHPDVSARVACSACHSRDVPRFPSHTKFVAQCSLCHSSTAWRPAQFKHDGVVNYRSQQCLSCHAPENRYHDKTWFNQQTGRSCENCHDTNRWKPANFNHDVAVASPALTCLSCHRVPRDSLHANVAPKGCLSCHTTQSWSAMPHSS